MKKVFLNILAVGLIFSLVLSTFGLSVNMCKCDGRDFDTYSINLKYKLAQEKSDDCCKTDCTESDCSSNKNDENSNCSDNIQNYVFDLKLNLKSNLDFTYNFQSNLENTPLIYILEPQKPEIIKYNQTPTNFFSPIKRLIVYIINKSGKAKANS